MASRERKYSRRPAAAALVTLLGAVVFVGTWLLSGAGVEALVLNAGYAVGGALLLFTVLYLLGERFEAMSLKNHGFVRIFEKALGHDEQDPPGRDQP